MYSKKIKLGEIVFKISTEKESLIEKIEQVSSAYEFVNVKENACMQIFEEEISIIVNASKISIPYKTMARDIFPLINFFISFAAQKIDENLIYLHSDFVSQNKHGNLILGNFKAGKSTFARELEQNGYKILSADHSLIKVSNHCLFIDGTQKQTLNGGIQFLKNEINNKISKIDKIFNIIGACENGNVSIIKSYDPIIICKQIFEHAAWSYYVPQVEDGRNLANYIPNNLYPLCKKMSTIDYFSIRGDLKKAAEKVTLK